MFYESTSAALASLTKQETIARNLSAAQLPGYRAEHVVTSTFHNKMNEVMGTEDPMTNVQGVGDIKRVFDFTQGSLRQTDRNLDFAINGEGFFHARTENGMDLFTRNGDFTLSEDRTLVTHEGHPVMTTGDMAVKLRKSDLLETLNVNEIGVLTVKDMTGNERELGQLSIRTLPDKTKFQRVSANYFTVTDPNAQEDLMEPVEFKVLGKALENSNISPITEMASMIENTRRFEWVNKAIKQKGGLSKKENSVFG
jgi:flagellar basal body rod protein FlgG